MAQPTQAAFEDALRARWQAYTAASKIGPLLDLARPLSGQLLRPAVTYHAALAAGVDAHRVVDAALAVQCIHTASVLHDDVLDDATTRRGRATLPPKQGLLAGDLLITAAYDLAARLGPAAPAFATAVQRMAFGEARQNVVKRPDAEAYIGILADKSGALFGWAMAAPWLVDGREGEAATALVLGDRIGVIYQLLDDYLDWCPYTDTGKPPLQDARQDKLTLPVFEHRGPLPANVADKVAAVFAEGTMLRALDVIEQECAAWQTEAEAWLGAGAKPFTELLQTFHGRAREAYALNLSHILVQEKRYA